MKPDWELRLQAYLDGELSERQARRMAAWLANDAQAQQLAAELRHTKTLLNENEPEARLPESREFYWSKIERAIQRAEAAPERAAFHPWRLWQRYVAPLAGLALVAFLAIAVVNHSTGPQEIGGSLAEVENLSEHVGSFSFRSQSENMFVVWLYERGQTAQATEPESEPEEPDDLVIQ